MFNKRQLGLCCDKNDVIVLNDEDGVKHKICKKADSTTELAGILLNETAWLTCDVIDSAQKLLKTTSQFSGFQSVAVGRTLQFEVQDGEFIQILHCNSGHWLTISTIGSKHSEVFIYDSLYSSTSECVQFQIASLLATKENEIILNFVDVQMQSGTYDCGLFAEAFATCLSFGFSPGQYFFEQGAMRRHLWKCLQERNISLFPVKKERRYKQKIKANQCIPVFSFCQLPAMSSIDLIECSS